MYTDKIHTVLVNDFLLKVSQGHSRSSWKQAGSLINVHKDNLKICSFAFSNFMRKIFLNNIERLSVQLRFLSVFCSICISRIFLITSIILTQKVKHQHKANLDRDTLLYSKTHRQYSLNGDNNDFDAPPTFTHR